MMILLFGAKIQNKCLWQLKSEPNCRKNLYFMSRYIVAFVGLTAPEGIKKQGRAVVIRFMIIFAESFFR